MRNQYSVGFPGYEQTESFSTEIKDGTIRVVLDKKMIMEVRVSNDLRDEIMEGTVFNVCDELFDGFVIIRKIYKEKKYYEGQKVWDRTFYREQTDKEQKEMREDRIDFQISPNSFKKYATVVGEAKKRSLYGRDIEI
jgi:hypothetical protein